MVEYDKKTLERLIDGKLKWNELKPIISGKKDQTRFFKVLEILQERVPWSEKILLPLHEHLYIVSKDNERIVKCDCGFEFGTHEQNWKYNSRVRVRNTEEDVAELYPKFMGNDPEWEEIREYYCPGCYVLLDTEVVPPGYPPIFNFLPDIDAFYRNWLNIDPPDK